MIQILFKKNKKVFVKNSLCSMKENDLSYSSVVSFRYENL